LLRLAWATTTALALLIASAFTPTSLFAPSNPENPRSVFVIDHGTHSSLALETADGELIRYSYGDLRYYALRDTSLAAGAAALLIPTPATLGRAELAGPASVENLYRQSVVVVQIIHQLQVEGALADQLIKRLDGLHQNGVSDHIEVPAYGLTFAPHPADYFWARNSSTAIAGWLRELNVRVVGWGLIASWWFSSEF
jgi:hypothetical protein